MQTDGLSKNEIKFREYLRKYHPTKYEQLLIEHIRNAKEWKKDREI